MRLLALLASCLAVFATPAAAEEQSDTPASVEVMILGTYHFANPGQDVVNMEVDDVLLPKRQQEIQTLVDVLAEWQPTQIAVEQQTAPPEFVIDDFANAGELIKTDRNESIQIGYRLARQLGHDAIYGFDERSGEGEPDYFPFDKVQQFAAKNGQMEELQKLVTALQKTVAEEQAKLPQQSIAESLFYGNDPDILTQQHDLLYYSLLNIGDGDDQPGAVLNAMWYMRNAKMFSKVGMIAEPGDRILVLVGSGHATWLRHFVQHTPGYRLVGSMPYLKKAAALSGDSAE